MQTPPLLIPLWPAGAPGSEGWTQTEQYTQMPGPDGIRVVRNVAQPTLTAYLPEAAHATGTAAIVCPGGAFHLLAIDHEGVDVAAWLNARGVAAFVLRYRLLQTAIDDEVFLREMAETMADREGMRQKMQQIGPLVVADGLQAIRVVRRRAAEWGLTPDRIGILGFSAGGTVTTGVALTYDAESRPSFAAPIYTAPWPLTEIPADAPPLFLAFASDDQMAVDASLPLYRAWQAAKRPAELHVYSKGGHGFGMFSRGLPSDHWIDRMADWLRAEGMLVQ